MSSARSYSRQRKAAPRGRGGSSRRRRRALCRRRRHVGTGRRGGGTVGRRRRGRCARRRARGRSRLRRRCGRRRRRRRARRPSPGRGAGCEAPWRLRRVPACLDVGGARRLLDATLMCAPGFGYGVRCLWLRLPRPDFNRMNGNGSTRHQGQGCLSQTICFFLKKNNQAC